MSEPFVGEIRMFAGSYAPDGWLFCQGQTVQINDYEILFNLIGTTYGGDGNSTFGLPDMASRVPVHVGNLAGNNYLLGQTGGLENVTLQTQQLPPHGHTLATAGSAGTTNTPAGNTLLSDQGPAGTTPQLYGPYVGGSTVNLSPQSIQPSGGNQPHANIQPSLAINFIISMYGTYPSQG